MKWGLYTSYKESLGFADFKTLLLTTSFLPCSEPHKQEGFFCMIEIHNSELKNLILYSRNISSHFCGSDIVVFF